MTTVVGGFWIMETPIQVFATYL